MDIVQILTIFNLIFLVGGATGSFFAFKSARKAKTIEIQSQTIDALQQQIDAIKLKVEGLKEENTRQALIIEIIQSALKQKGIIVSIDGELVTFTFADGSASSTRKRSSITQRKPSA